MTEHMGTTACRVVIVWAMRARQIPIYQSTTWKYDTSGIWVNCLIWRNLVLLYSFAESDQ